MRKLLLVCALVAVVAAACGSDTGDTGAGDQAAPSGAQAYTVTVDWPSKEAKNYQFSAFYPSTLKVRPGDTVVFDNQSSQAIHTISFGFAHDRSNAPPPVIAGPKENPVVFGPCYDSEGVAAVTLDACPGVTPLQGNSPEPATPEFTGEGIWSTGILIPGNAPPPPGSPDPDAPAPPPAKAELTVAADAKPGSFQYVCLLHNFMNGTLEIVADDAERLSPSAVASAGEAEYERHEAAIASVADPTPGDGEVAAGFGDKVVAVNRFVPAMIEVKAGTTVTWRGASPYEPHTVSFGELPFKPATSDPRELVPGGTPPGGKHAGGYAHSGVFGPKPGFPVDSYSIAFTKAGQYPYLCVFHPGMGGVVKVI